MRTKNKNLTKMYDALFEQTFEGKIGDAVQSWSFMVFQIFVLDGLGWVGLKKLGAKHSVTIGYAIRVIHGTKIVLIYCCFKFSSYTKCLFFI